MSTFSNRLSIAAQRWETFEPTRLRPGPVRSLLGSEHCSKTIGQSVGLLLYRLKRRERRRRQWAQRTIQILFLVDLGFGRWIFDRARDEFYLPGGKFKSNKENRRKGRPILVFFCTPFNHYWSRVEEISNFQSHPYPYSDLCLSLWPGFDSLSRYIQYDWTEKLGPNPSSRTWRKLDRKDIQRQWPWLLDYFSIVPDRSSRLLNGWITWNRIWTWLTRWRCATTRENSKKCSASSMNGTKRRINDRSRWWSLRLWRRVPEWKIFNVAWRFIIQFHSTSKEIHLSWHLSFISTVSSLMKCIPSQSLSQILVECGEMSKAEVLFDQATMKSVAMYGAMMKGKREVLRDEFTLCFSLLRLCDTQSGPKGDRSLSSNPNAGWHHHHCALHCLCSVERRRRVEIGEDSLIHITQVIAFRSYSSHVSIGRLDEMRRCVQCSTLLRSIKEKRFVDVRSDDER